MLMNSEGFRPHSSFSSGLQSPTYLLQTQGSYEPFYSIPRSATFHLAFGGGVSDMNLSAYAAGWTV